MNISDLIISKDKVQGDIAMQIQQEAYFNFVNSIDSDSTKKIYEYCISKFLNYYNLDLDSFLRLPQQEISNLIIKYLVDKKISRQYKTVIVATIKHACEMNDVILNWKKLKKFIKSEKTDNEINGKDRGYTHQEIQKILEFSDQRIRTAFLVLASTGMRIGGLQYLRIRDLEKLDDVYKITVYSGDKEEYITFCTPETAKEIDSYLDFRKRRGEKITNDSYLIVKKFSMEIEGFKGKPFNGCSLRAVLEDYINNSGLREIDHKNRFKRKQVPLLHGFRKFFTTQLVNSKLNPEIREMLLGHKIGLASCYYKPTEREMLSEYYKAVNLLTINEENRLKLKLEQKIQIEKSQIEALKADFEKFKNEVLKQRFKNKNKIKWQESLSWDNTNSFGHNVRIRPVNFNTEHKNMLSNLHAVISKGYLAIPSKFEKLVTSLRTAYATELSLDKDQTSYNDLLDALRLSLKGYQIN